MILCKISSGLVITEQRTFPGAALNTLPTSFLDNSKPIQDDPPYVKDFNIDDASLHDPMSVSLGLVGDQKNRISLKGSGFSSWNQIPHTKKAERYTSVISV